MGFRIAVRYVIEVVMNDKAAKQMFEQGSQLTPIGEMGGLPDPWYRNSYHTRYRYLSVRSTRVDEVKVGVP